MKQENRITKYVWQYSEKLPEETMEALRGIALDYSRVKNEVYKRYAGIKNMNRLTPYYDVMKEMRRSGLRERLGLPVSYFEVAVTDAVTDIKITWGVTKNKIREVITANENLSDSDKMYLRTVLKINSTYAAILNRQNYPMPENCKGIEIDTHRLNNLLCRYTRKYLTKPHTEYTGYFSLKNDGYLYKEAKTLRIPSRIPKKKLCIPLKDDMVTSRQPTIYVREHDIAISITIDKKVKRHEDYTNTVYIHIGNKDMFTLSNGHIYGQNLWNITAPETERLSHKSNERQKMYLAYAHSMEEGNIKKAEAIMENNLGKVKYNRIKEREKGKTTTFINAEINRMLREEKPSQIVITKPVTKNRSNYHMRATNRKVTRSFQGYVRKRLAQKCAEQSITIREINAKGTGSTCSICGAEGERLPEGFVCMACKSQLSIALNSAKNIERLANEI